MPTPRKIPSTGIHAVVDGAFLRFWEERTRINQAVAALTFSQRLTMHEIATLRPHLRDRHLGDLYPAKVARGSFDYQLGKAETYLADASGFLFDASFISCQPAYERYLDEVVELVADAVAVSPPVGNGANPPSIPKRHRWLVAQSVVVGDGWLELFDVLREARNSYVHAGGRVAQRLVNARLALTAQAQAHWKRVAGDELPAMNLDDRLAVGTFDPIAAIYAIGNLGLELNRALQRSNLIALERWADVAVRDYRQRSPSGWNADTTTRPRRALGHARQWFAAALPAIDDAMLINRALKRALADRHSLP